MNKTDPFMNLPNYTVARQTTALAGDPIIDAMQEGFCELDREGIVVRVNHALCKMTGFEPNEILGSSQPFPFWPEEEIERLQRMFYKPLEEGQTHQVTFKRKSGQRFTAMVSPSAVTNDRGEIVTFFATIKDISELMASRKRQRMLSLVADKTTDAVIVAGPDYRIVWVNEAFERLTGFTLAEVYGHKPGRMLQGENTSMETRRIIREHLNRQESVAVEILNYAKDGKEYWLDLNINPVFDDDGDLEFYIAVERDITVKKEAELALQLALDQLEEIQEIAKIGFWELNYKTGHLGLSDTCFSIYGINKDAFKPNMRSLMMHIHPDDAGMVRNALNQAPFTGDYDLVYRVVRGDGEVRYVQERGMVVYDNVQSV